MHYYQFNIGDYMRDTAHLDEMEDLAYRRMLDLYYLKESPLPKDVKEIAKLIRMRTHTDCIASVLQEFFTASDNGYINEKADEVLASIYDKSDKARLAAEKRWNKQKVKNADAMQTHSESNADGMLPNTHNPIPNNPDTQLKVLVDSGESPVSNLKQDATLVFEHWKLVMAHPRAVLDEKRLKLITKWLKAGYSTETLIDSITGYTHSAHHMGANDKQTKYDSIELLLRDAGHIDSGLKHLHLHKNPQEIPNGYQNGARLSKHDQLTQWSLSTTERLERELNTLREQENIGDCDDGKQGYLPNFPDVDA